MKGQSGERTVVIEARVDLRTLSAILTMYQRIGTPIRSKSHLLNIIIEDLYNILLTNQLIDKRPDHESALEHLNKTFSSVQASRSSLSEAELKVVPPEHPNQMEVDEIARLLMKGGEEESK